MGWASWLAKSPMRSRPSGSREAEAAHFIPVRVVAPFPAGRSDDSSRLAAEVFLSRSAPGNFSGSVVMARWWFLGMQRRHLTRRAAPESGKPGGDECPRRAKPCVSTGGGRPTVQVTSGKAAWTWSVVSTRSAEGVLFARARTVVESRRGVVCARCAIIQSPWGATVTPAPDPAQASDGSPPTSRARAA